MTCYICKNPVDGTFNQPHIHVHCLEAVRIEYVKMRREYDDQVRREKIESHAEYLTRAGRAWGKSDRPVLV